MLLLHVCNGVVLTMHAGLCLDAQAALDFIKSDSYLSKTPLVS